MVEEEVWLYELLGTKTIVVVLFKMFSLMFLGIFFISLQIDVGLTFLMKCL